MAAPVANEFSALLPKEVVATATPYNPTAVYEESWKVMKAAAIELADFNADYATDCEKETLHRYSKDYLLAMRHVKIIKPPISIRAHYNGIPLDISDKIMQLVKLVDMDGITAERYKQWRPKAEEIVAELDKVTPYQTGCIVS